jgi:hypothetical protein
MEGTVMRSIRNINAFAISVAIFTVFALMTAAEASERSTSSAVKLLKAPLLFEPNEGQSARGVDFVAHGHGYVLHLTPTAAVFALPHERLSMRLVGSSELAEPIIVGTFRSQN